MEALSNVLDTGEGNKVTSTVITPFQEKKKWRRFWLSARNRAIRRVRRVIQAAENSGGAGYHFNMLTPRSCWKHFAISEIFLPELA